MKILARYMCHNCGDLVLKSITSVLDHVWAKHKIEVTKIWQPIIRSEDARLSPTKTSKKKVVGFRCETCNTTWSKTSSLLVHLDKAHGIHIWYEKGLTKKRVYFDGILDKSGVSTRATTEFAEMTSVPISMQNIPLSERPHELRKKIRVKRQVNCGRCGKTLKKGSEVWIHREIRKSIMKTEYYCPTCYE